MVRLLGPALMIAAVLGISRSNLSTVRAEAEVPVVYTGESIPTAADLDDSLYDEDAATEKSWTDDSATGPASESDPAESNPSASGAEDADKLGPASDDEPELEVIYERYPDGSIKVQRSVSQDDDGNYGNEGLWRMWDQKGALVAEGTYRNGEREGVWNRWYRAGEVELLTKPPYNGFQGPFISQATFVGGKLDGNWTIYDGKQRKISQREFVEGQRDGRFTWWFANGRKMREIDYSQGEIDGQLVEWTIDGKVLTKETYQHGRKLANRLERDLVGAKKTEGQYLFAKEVEKTPDDWWNAQPATFVKEGRDEKHGPWASWYPNGQPQSEGEYRNDVQVGKFVWWYSNGQKTLEGIYVDGEQQDKWVWWHENGQKAIQGEYTKGHPSGRWIWWNADGKVARSTEMGSGAGELVKLPEKAQPHSVLRSAARPLVPTIARPGSNPVRSQQPSVRR